jgi:hypothetical protein
MANPVHSDSDKLNLLTTRSLQYRRRFASHLMGFSGLEGGKRHDFG